MKRIIRLIVLIMAAFSLCFCCAENSGTVGKLTWALSDNGVFTINGKGTINNYRDSGAPWQDCKDQIIAVYINEGITGIGDWAFEGCKNLTHVFLPSSLKRINWFAFQNCSSLQQVVFSKDFSSKESPIKAGRFPVKVGKLRGKCSKKVWIKYDNELYEGIIDYKHQTILWPQRFIEVFDTDDDGLYYGGKDTGIFWIYNNQTKRYAFWDVQTGFFSGFKFHYSQDLLFDDNRTDFLRVTEDGRQHYYINRRNGERLFDLTFSGINTSGMYKGYAIERTYDTKEYVVISDKGCIYRIPAGYTPWNDRVEKGVLYLESIEGEILEIKMNTLLDWEDAE